MKLSVAYTFEPGLIEGLAPYSEIYEVYGKAGEDPLGGGRSSYTLRQVSFRSLAKTVQKCHAQGIAFNYLLNGASLGGIEQTRRGHRIIRKLLDRLSHMGVDSLTVTSPFLTRLIKKQYPHFSIRVSAFAMIDSPEKARQWEDLGGDALCLSAISCNRDLRLLEDIRRSVQTDLQLIVNSSCLPYCAYEPTHMNLLSDSSRKGHPLKGMCIDYCILNCAQKRFSDPRNFLRAVWIRPEDVHIYESIGINSFKILERSCPKDLLIKRVEAYARRSFTGNLYELVGPVAAIKKEQGTELRQRLKMIRTMFKPGKVPMKSLLRMKRFGESLIPHAYDRDSSYIYIDNTRLNGFLESYLAKPTTCGTCGATCVCASWVDRAVSYSPSQLAQLAHEAAALEEDVHTSRFWGCSFSE
ncbi:U32 family peptidase [Chitinivibrio alkaliphilus]|uniref:Peptidase U32 n=1 Tax=Chitinivibrio alkaliphilus ACht1 TaxID=1313304 RepID=U7D9G9_9BACT|nr:U32 family peptidase [Chitinivibrio alkaliphilus]ERP38672.1 peptidase U32 [Chitinivibrio alkaliphilus ACht1]